MGHLSKDLALAQSRLNPAMDKSTSACYLSCSFICYRTECSITQLELIVTDSSPPGIPLNLPFPSELAETFGYRGDARFVGFYWSPCGDEVIYTDGRSTGTGQSWTFLTYRRHRTVAPLLAGWNLGYSDQDADHCLILDRERNRISIAPIAEARTFLKSQHPPRPELSPEQAETLREQVESLIQQWREADVDPAEVQRLMDDQRSRLAQMVAFLNTCPLPPGAGQTP